MQIAISNIAWDPVEDTGVVQLLQQYAIDAIDIVPAKYFPDIALATDKAIAQVRDWWADKGIALTGMQALFFGTAGLNVFDVSSQPAMLQHLTNICRIGNILGARKIVFGAPKNRDRSGLSDEVAMEIAADFFQKLGSIAKSLDVKICLEPNPIAYGANFMTTNTETLQVVQYIAHDAIKMQLDTGALAMNQEPIESALASSWQFIGHIHASEPNLLPLGDGGVDHAKIAMALQRCMPDSLVSIEMLATKAEPHLDSIERALKVAVRAYRDIRIEV